MGRTSYRFAVAMFSLMPALAFASTEGKSEEQKTKIQTIKLPKTERMVCRSEPVLGSHFKKRVCRTESQIAAEREAARDSLKSLGRAGSTNARSRRGG